MKHACRPAALRSPRVFLTAAWRYLVMLNYEMPAEAVRPFVPLGTELDTFEGRTLISVVGFRFLQTRVLGVAVPFHRNFDEVNLRFYVKRVLPDGEARRAVTFIREVVPRRAIAAMAKAAYNEPYLALPMESVAPSGLTDSPGRVSYSWKTRFGWEYVAVTAVGNPSTPPAGSEAAFITEHYWGYTRQRNGHTLEYEVAHPPWRVWKTAEAELSPGVAAFYGGPFEALLRVSPQPRSAFVAEGSAVKVLCPRLVC